MKWPRKNSLIVPVLRYLGETTPDLLNVGIKVLVDPGQLVRDTFGSGLYTAPRKLRHIEYLKKSKYLRRAGLRSTYELTSAGRVAVLRVKIRDKLEKAAIQWDGMYRAIGFDIKEERRRDRAFLRQELRALGLIEVQHSLWMTPVDITAELLSLLKLWKTELAGDVRVFLIKEMHPDGDIRKQFRMNKPH